MNYIYLIIFEEELDRQNTSNTKKDFEEEDLVKFISLGYYVYTHLIEKIEILFILNKMLNIKYSNAPIVIGTKSGHITPGTFGAISDEGVLTFPPINTNINVTNLSSVTQAHHNFLMATTAESSIPKNFDLSSKTSKVRNQKLCGSCWAVSTATIF